MLQLKGLSVREARVEAGTLCEDLGLTKDLHTPVRRLSPAKRRMLGVATAFAGGTKVGGHNTAGGGSVIRLSYLAFPQYLCPIHTIVYHYTSGDGAFA